MARTKGSKSIAPEARACVDRIEAMLKAHDPAIGSLERLACRLMVHDGNKAMETKFFASDGVVTDSRECINWAARLKAAEIAKDIWRTLMQYKHGMPKQEVTGEDGKPFAIQIVSNIERPKRS